MENVGDTSTLALPDRIVVSRHSLAGPLARGALSIGMVRTILVNTGDAPVAVSRVFLTPLANADDGTVPPGGAALSTETDSLTLDPAQTAAIDIAGTVPARPGVYSARLEVVPAASAPVIVNVAASPAWGIACMLLGLLLLGIVNLLTGEGGVQEKARDVERTRAGLQAWFVAHPPPLQDSARVADIDADLDEAARTLAAPRPLSAVDRRVADADALLTAANQQITALQARLQQQPPGAQDVADLVADWTALQSRMQSLVALDAGSPQAGSPQAGSPQAGPLQAGVGDHATALLRRAAQRFLQLPIQLITADLGPHLERVRLVEASGDTARATAMTVDIRGWLRRAARELEWRLSLIMQLGDSVRNMAESDSWIRELAAGDDLPADLRVSLIAQLDAIDNNLANARTLGDLYVAERTVQTIETEAIRGVAERAKTRAAEAAEVAGNAMSTDFVDATLAAARDNPHPTPQQKADVILKILHAWRGILPVVQDPQARAAMAEDLEQAEAAAKRTDLAAVLTSMHSLEKRWSDDIPRHIATAVAVALAPVCRTLRDRTVEMLANAVDQIALLSGDENYAGWDRRLDSARHSLLAAGRGPIQNNLQEAADCIGNNVNASTIIFGVISETFTRGIPIAPDARLDSSESGALADAIALTDAFKNDLQPLHLVAQTPEDDRLPGTPLGFAVTGLNPDWAGGVQLVIDWGDGSPVTRHTAETLRQAGTLQHVYAKAGTIHPLVVAAERFASVTPGSVVAAGPELGRGSVDLFVGRSRASTAERLADIFLTASFALSLFIASVLYFWRYADKNRVFGARGFDYAEAFTLGFLASLAVSELPKMLSEIPFPT
jgi:hypothetical protein